MLDLYVMDTCPYCQKVMTYLSGKNINYRKFDLLENRDYAKDLLALGGKDQVPFLYNEETDDRIYDSDKIIEYVNNLG